MKKEIQDPKLWMPILSKKPNFPLAKMIERQGYYYVGYVVIEKKAGSFFEHHWKLKNPNSREQETITCHELAPF